MGKVHTHTYLPVSMVAAIGVVSVVPALATCAFAAEPAPTAADMLRFERETERKPLTSEQEAALHQMHVARATRALSELQVAQTIDKRFYALPDAAMGAFFLEHYSQAAQLASETLELANSFNSDWNYGNAIHRAHTVKGLLALHDGDIPNAVAELHKAGATRGSPQLDSFGPTWC